MAPVGKQGEITPTEEFEVAEEVDIAPEQTSADKNQGFEIVDLSEYVEKFRVGPGGDLYLDVPFASTHFGLQKQTRNGSEPFNEKNIGIGLSYQKRDGRKEKYYSVGAVKNSMGDQSFYLGGGKKWRVLGNNKLNMKLGFYAGLIHYPTSPIKTFPGILPTIDIGGKNYGLQLTVIPPVHESVKPAVLASFRRKLSK